MRKQDVAKGGGLEPIINVFKMCVKLGRRGEETNLSKCIAQRWAAKVIKVVPEEHAQLL